MYVVLPRNYLKNMKVIPFELFAQEKPANARVLLLSKHECDWWVHSRCVTIYYENSEAREKTWAKKHFCQKHNARCEKSWMG